MDELNTPQYVYCIANVMIDELEEDLLMKAPWNEEAQKQLIDLRKGVMPK